MHSFNSNVSIRSSTVSVVSDESRIDLTERFLSGQVWSQNSLLEFEPRGHSENIYATDTVRTLFSVLGANLSTKADRLEVMIEFFFVLLMSSVVDFDVLACFWVGFAIVSGSEFSCRLPVGNVMLRGGFRRGRRGRELRRRAI